MTDPITLAQEALSDPETWAVHEWVALVGGLLDALLDRDRQIQELREALLKNRGERDREFFAMREGLRSLADERDAAQRKVAAVEALATTWAQMPGRVWEGAELRGLLRNTE